MGQKYATRHPLAALVMKIFFYIVLFFLWIFGVLGILALGFAGGAVAFAMCFTLFMWPMLLKSGAAKLRDIRREYFDIVRADATPHVSVPQILGLYALIFSPAFVLAFLAFIMPWGVGAIGILFIPSLVLYILFSVLHGTTWVDIGFKRIWYILYLFAMYFAVVGVALLVRALT